MESTEIANEMVEKCKKSLLRLQILGHRICGFDQTRFFMCEYIERRFSMVSTHTAHANTTEWQR